MSRNHIAEAWLVIVLSMVFGSSLAAVHIALTPRIEANKLSDTMSQVPVLVPNATRAERQVVGDQVFYKALDAAGMLAGWVVPASGQGFADRVELLVGFDAPAGRITGVYVLEQKETPGLGDNITTDDFRKRFVGKTTDAPLAARKGAAPGDSDILALTGATISSESVTAIVNAAVRRLKAQLAAGTIR